MTIDERLEKLAERHEAVAQSLELIARMQRQNERRFELTDQKLEVVIGIVKDLAEIVRSHDHRIDRPEGH